LVQSSNNFGQRQQKLSSKVVEVMTLEEGKVRIEKLDGNDFRFLKM